MFGVGGGARVPRVNQIASLTRIHPKMNQVYLH